MDQHEYSLDDLHQIIDGMKTFKEITLRDEALTRILGLLEVNSNQSEDQKFLKTSAIIEGQNAYIPTHKKVDRKVTAADSPIVKRQTACRELNRLNKENAASVATEMKKCVGNHVISSIFFDALFMLNDDNLEKFDLWEYWIKLLPELNKNNNEFKNDIVNDTMEKFKSLEQTKASVASYQLISCWFSCLLSAKFITPEKYAQLLLIIIKSNQLKTSEIVTVIYSSLSISGKIIDDRFNPLTKCWFLFNFLKMNLSECPSYLKFKIIDLFDLRKFNWDHKLYQDHFEGSSKPKTSKYRPPGSRSQESFSKAESEKDSSYQQQEFWEDQFTSYVYHPDSYKVPQRINQDNQTVTKTLLTLIIKKKGKDIKDFLEFGNIILTTIFNNNINEFTTTMIKSKVEFRKIFEGEEIQIFNENHIRFYNIIATFLISNWENLYKYVDILFDTYLHINDFNTNDQVLSPIPSVFIESIFKISETEDYLRPQECNTLLSKFPERQEDFNNLVFQNNSKDDYWPFLSQLAYDTNPEDTDAYLDEKKDKEIDNYSFYDRLLFLYNKCYKDINDEENLQVITQAANFITVGIDENQKRNIVDASLNLLRKDNTIDDEQKKKLRDFILKDSVG